MMMEEKPQEQMEVKKFIVSSEQKQVLSPVKACFFALNEEGINNIIQNEIRILMSVMTELNALLSIRCPKNPLKCTPKARMNPFQK